MATNINNRLVCNEPHANLDSYYGPYDSVDAAFNALASTTVNGVTYTKRYVGLTVGIWNSAKTEITEYWFKGGTAKTNLVVKTDGSGGGLPSGIKIVTFDKNGGSGVQNSILTDTNSQIVLPECTFTKSGETFSKWSYNGAQKNPGDIITIGSATVVQAVWNSTKPSHTITVVANPSYGGTVTGGGQYDSGATATLNAIPNSGYRFVSWSDGGNQRHSVTVTKNATYTATFDLIPTPKQFTVNFTKGTGVSNITGKKRDGSAVESGKKYDEGTEIILTAVLEDGYGSVVWEPNDIGTVSEDTLTLTFTLTNEVAIKTTGQKSGDAEFYYYGCSSTEEESADSKCFEDPKQLKPSWTTQVNIEKNSDNYLYVVTKYNEVTPRCIPNEGDALEMNKITECGDSVLIRYLMDKQWIAENGETGDALKDYGSIMYLLIDKDKKISDGQPITISLKKS